MMQVRRDWWLAVAEAEEDIKFGKLSKFLLILSRMKRVR
jgi:hypothetical protein